MIVCCMNWVVNFVYYLICNVVCWLDCFVIVWEGWMWMWDVFDWWVLVFVSVFMNDFGIIKGDLVFV